MPKPKGEPFNDVEFRTEYPGANVADHEVLLSFNGDSQAEAFNEWWHSEGSFAFNKFLQKQEKE